MPSHKVHCLFDRVMFGKSYRRLHEAIDKPVAVLGRKHRIFFHDGFSAVEIARKVFPYDPVAEEAAAVHIWLDNECTQNPYYKKQLEQLADMDAQNRKNVQVKRVGRKRRKNLPQQPCKDTKKRLGKCSKLKE